MNKIKGLTPGYTILDIEKFCRDNWDRIKKKQAGNKPINFDYTDGIKDILREIIDYYFGGL